MMGKQLSNHFSLSILKSNNGLKIDDSVLSVPIHLVKKKKKKKNTKRGNVEDH